MNPILTKISSALNIYFDQSGNVNSIDSQEENKHTLKFSHEGKFKIVQFSDSQDGPKVDPRTLKLMHNILEYEKPDLVVLTGDNIDGKCKSSDDVRKAITNIADPMERRRIPWATVFGNHDDEHGKMSKEEMMRFYMSFDYNLSKIGYKTYDRVGNYNLLIEGSSDNMPAFNIYMLDSGKYAPFFIGIYDWIRQTQINWYKQTTLNIKHKYNKTIPSLMFFHIPLPEFKEAFRRKLLHGEKLESESSPKINTGFFKTLLETGDVKGVFVGHDHLNNYCSILNGIKLGFARSVGYGTYGRNDVPRGARVFLINESDPSNFRTWMRHASDKELNLSF